MKPCAFCEIVAGRARASVAHADDRVLAFMTLRPTAPGECLVIPRDHVDHFTDLPDELAQHLMLVGLRLGRRVREVFRPQRLGFLVHGYGVAHAHLIVVPQHGPHHLTSDRYARIDGDRVVFDFACLPVADRTVLDDYARRLGSGPDYRVG